MRCAPVPSSSPKTRRCSTGRRRLEANIAFFVRDRANGPVSRPFLAIRTMSRDASTASSCAGFKTARRAHAAHRSHRHRDMYVGAWVKALNDASADHEFHVGPHRMVVGPHQDEFQGFNRDGSNGMPYVTHLRIALSYSRSCRFGNGMNDSSRRQASGGVTLHTRLVKHRRSGYFAAVGIFRLAIRIELRPGPSTIRQLTYRLSSYRISPYGSAARNPRSTVCCDCVSCATCARSTATKIGINARRRAAILPP